MHLWQRQCTRVGTSCAAGLLWQAWEKGALLWCEYNRLNMSSNWQWSNQRLKFGCGWDFVWILKEYFCSRRRSTRALRRCLMTTNWCGVRTQSMWSKNFCLILLFYPTLQPAFKSYPGPQLFVVTWRNWTISFGISFMHLHSTHVFPDNKRCLHGNRFFIEK